MGPFMPDESTLSICSWNVNSLKVRFEQVKQRLETQRWDIVCLQETKMTDDRFPYEALETIGYAAFHAGQPTYNGVATLARMDRFKHIEMLQSRLPHGDDPQQRFLLAKFDNLLIANIYVPNGQAVDSDKYRYKLSWLDHLLKFLNDADCCRQPFVLLGDFNIAPHDLDVHDPEGWREQILCSTPERDRFHQLLELGLFDSLRHIDPTTRLYSWWDYRQLAFQKNKGLRIDHILISKAMLARLYACEIDRQARKAEKASDHAPVIARFKSLIN
jgi:exodeoxyribonuclease-3